MACSTSFMAIVNPGDPHPWSGRFQSNTTAGGITDSVANYVASPAIGSRACRHGQIVATRPAAADAS